jgi:hypothetical protein
VSKALWQETSWANKGVGQPFIEINNISKLIKSEAQCGYDSPTVELSQAMDNFQQQQTGRLL